MREIGATDGSPAPAVLVIAPDPYLLRACDRLGLDVVVVYGQSVTDAGSASIPARMKRVFAEDHQNAGVVLAALARAGIDGRRFDAVISANEYTVPLAALLASHFGCRGLPVDVAVRFRDKSEQKRALRSAGVPVADWQVIEDIQMFDALPELSCSPMVLKPIAGVGTQFTMLVRDAGELLAAARRIAAVSSLRTFLLERYIPNEEWIVDGVIRDGELAFYSMGYYPVSCMAVVEQQGSMTYARFDPVADKDIFEEAGPFAKRALDALGLDNSVFHMELFKPTDGGPLTFGECAARRGASMHIEEVLWKFDVDLAEEGLRAAVGLPARLDIRIRPGAVGVTNVNAPAGVLFSCPSIDDVLALPGVRYARIEFPRGASLSGRVPNAASRLAQVLITAEERSQLPERFEQIRQWFGERLVVAPAAATHRTLRGWQQQHWPGSTVGDEQIFDPDERDNEVNP